MSWIEEANKPNCPFSIANLPWGVAKFPDGSINISTAISDKVLSLKGLSNTEAFKKAAGNDAITKSLQESNLNSFMALGGDAWKKVRELITSFLAKDGANAAVLRDDAKLQGEILIAFDKVEMILPANIGDYTDFYISRHHASNIGKMFRPNQPPLLENWLHLPVGYHGRSSSIVVSGTPIRRPNGQRRPVEGQPPVFGPAMGFDFELEMAVWIGTGNNLGEPIKVDDAENHIFGYSMFNDWSARDLQKWEYVPLGPFLGKNFGSTMGCWIISPMALAPFKCDGPSQADVQTLPYLASNKNGTYDVEVAVDLTNKEGETLTISKSNVKHGYWSASQIIAHHTCNGCNLRPGDVVATGTLSGPEEGMYGCMLEITWQGTKPLKFEKSGQERKMLQDGDTVVLRGECTKGELTIGFGPCSGTVTPAVPY